MIPILIGSLRRHGGAMLARLLDSHPDVYSLPIERGFGRAPRDWLRERTAKSHWPELEELMASRDLARIESAIDLAQYARLLRRQWFEDNAFDVRLDADVFAEQFRKVLRRSDGWDRQTIWDAEIESFYRSVCDGAHWDGPRSFVVNHCATSIFLPLEKYFRAFENSRFVYTVRNPLAVYASIKRCAALDRGRRPFRWGVGGDDDEVAVDMWTTRWVQGVIAALCAKREFGERFVLVRYEDLVRDTEGAMAELAASLGLAFDPILLRPTLFGRSWTGNSSFGALAGVSSAPLEQWRDHVSARERDRIAARVGRLMTLLGYGSGAELAPFERSVDECLAQLGHLSRASAGDFSLEAEVLRLRRENAALRYRLARSPLRQRWNLLAAWAQRR